MKNVFLLLIFCLVITTGCVSIWAGGESRFHRVDVREENLRIGGLNVPATYTYHLTDNEFIAIGEDTSVVERLVFLVDRGSSRVIYRSEIWDNTYGWWLNIYKIGRHVFILWEEMGEYYTHLSLFVFNKNTRTCSYAGEFDVCQYFDEEVDTAPYPIEGIHVEASDTLVSFKFTKKLHLKKYDTGSQVADSLTYELDLRSDSLRVSKIWTRDTLR